MFFDDDDKQQQVVVVQNQDDSKEFDTKSASLIVLVGATIFLPMVAVTALITWLTFSKFRIKRSVIASFLGIYSLLLLPFISPAIRLFLESWESLLSVFAPDADVAGAIIGFILLQTPIAIPLGLLVGLGYASYRWWTKPKWETMEFRLTPLELYKRKKTIADIREDKNGPKNGVTLGINQSGKRVVQTDAAAAAHTLVVGASGTGKTTTLMSRARDTIRRGQALVFVDLKGGPDVPAILADYAKRYDREFVHWIMLPEGDPYQGPAETGPSYYDPLGRGDATRRKDLVVSSRKWSEEYYKQESSKYLLLMFRVLIAVPNTAVSTLEDMVHLLNPVNLYQRALKLQNTPNGYELIESIESYINNKMAPAKKSAIDSLQSQIEIFLHSVAGPWLRLSSDPNKNIDFVDVSNKGKVVVFSLDSSRYSEQSALLANLIIQDIQTVSSELRHATESKRMSVYIDEFSAIGSDNIISLAQRSRDAGIPITLATQALGDLFQIDTSFYARLIGTINSFIIHRANSNQDAEIYAGLSGKHKVAKIRQEIKQDMQSAMGRGDVTGSGTFEEVEEYIVSPNNIQNFGIGQMVYISKSPTVIEYVQSIPEGGRKMTPDYPVSVDVNVFNRTDFDQKVKAEAEKRAEAEAQVFQEELPEVTVKHSDPERLKSILNDEDAIKMTDSGVPFTKAALPDRNALPDFNPKPVSKPGLPTVPPLPPKLPKPPVIGMPKTETKNEEPKEREKDEFDF